MVHTTRLHYTTWETDNRLLQREESYGLFFGIFYGFYYTCKTSFISSHCNLSYLKACFLIRKPDEIFSLFKGSDYCFSPEFTILQLSY